MIPKGIFDIRKKVINITATLTQGYSGNPYTVYDLNLYDVYVANFVGYGHGSIYDAATTIVNFTLVIPEYTLLTNSEATKSPITVGNFANGSNIKVLNYGIISGKGGDGGNGGFAYVSPSQVGGNLINIQKGQNGKDGLQGILINKPITIDNRGIISSGGGGGGGTGGAAAYNYSAYFATVVSQSGNGGGGGWPFSTSSSGSPGRSGEPNGFFADNNYIIAPYFVGAVATDRLVVWSNVGNGGVPGSPGGRRDNIRGAYTATSYEAAHGGDGDMNGFSVTAGNSSYAAIGPIGGASYVYSTAGGIGGKKGAYAVKGNSFITWNSFDIPNNTGLVVGAILA